SPRPAPGPRGLSTPAVAAGTTWLPSVGSVRDFGMTLQGYREPGALASSLPSSLRASGQNSVGQPSRLSGAGETPAPPEFCPLALNEEAAWFGSLGIRVSGLFRISTFGFRISFRVCSPVGSAP